MAVAVAEDSRRGAELRETKLEPSGHQEEATGRPTSLSGSELGIQPCYFSAIAIRPKGIFSPEGGAGDGDIKGRNLGFLPYGLWEMERSLQSVPVEENL